MLLHILGGSLQGLGIWCTLCTGGELHLFKQLGNQTYLKHKTYVCRVEIHVVFQSAPQMVDFGRLCNVVDYHLNNERISRLYDHILFFYR